MSTLSYTWPNRECQIFGSLQLAELVQAKAKLLHAWMETELQIFVLASESKTLGEAKT